MLKLWKNIIFESLIVKKIIEYYKEVNKKRKEDKEKKMKEIIELEDEEKAQIKK